MLGCIPSYLLFQRSGTEQVVFTFNVRQWMFHAKCKYCIDKYCTAAVRTLWLVQSHRAELWESHQQPLSLPQSCYILL